MHSLALVVFLSVAFARLRAYEVAGWFRPASSTRALTILRRWSRWVCPRLRLRVEVDGRPPAAHCLYVANHRTYLDIPVLTSALGATFLARADVATWPLIGSLARHTEAVLVQRDDARDRMRAARRLLRRLRTASVVVFPEATTTGAPLPLPFQSGLFRLVQRLDVPVVPVTVRYSERRAYWLDEVTVWEHLRSRVLTQASLRVSVHVGDPLVGKDFDGADALGAAVYDAVCRPIRLYGELV